MDVLRAAQEAGADRLVLCDTNGGTLPADIASIVARVVADVGRHPWASTCTTTPDARSRIR